jgi:cytochrome c553
MKNVCIVMALVMLIAAPLTLLAAEDGAALFKTKCANCHGEKGEGKTMGTMKMPAVKSTKMTAEQLVTYITKGQAGNKIHANPVSGVNEEQATAVADFAKTLK